MNPLIRERGFILWLCPFCQKCHLIVGDEPPSVFMCHNPSRNVTDIAAYPLTQDQLYLSQPVAYDKESYINVRAREQKRERRATLRLQLTASEFDRWSRHV
jgi:hypothetical protein